MELVKGNLFNEETKIKPYAQIHMIESRGRKKNKGQKGHKKFKRKSQSKDKIKCFHCGKGHMKMNCRIWKKEQNRQDQEKEDDKNITTSISNNDEVLVLLNECLYVDE